MKPTYSKPHLATVLFSLLAGAALTVVPGATGVAWAQPADEIKPDDPELKPPPTTDPTDRAKEFYVRGRKNYDLGKFRRAVALFTRAYEELPDGAFLFNIAQSYRQLDECKQSLFFYKRFLSVQKNIPAETKKDVDGHIVVLEQCVKNQEDIRRRPPDGTAPPDDLGTGSGNTGGGNTGGGDTTSGNTGGGNTGGGNTAGGPGNTGGGDGRVAGLGDGDGGGDGDGDGDGDGAVDNGGDGGGGAKKPHVIALFARGGGAKVGAGDLPIPVLFAASLSAGYPIAIGDKLALDVGAGFGFTPVPWSGAMGESGSASLTTIAAHVGATFEVAPKIGIRGELDVGVTLFGGLDAGNPFTRDAEAASGALSMVNVRAGLAGEYAITNQVSAVATPIAFSYSPTNEFFAEGIDSITRIEFLVGLGYRM